MAAVVEHERGELDISSGIGIVVCHADIGRCVVLIALTEIQFNAPNYTCMEVSVDSWLAAAS